MALLTRSRRDVPTSVIPTGGFPACADLHESKPGAFQPCLAPFAFGFNLTFGDARPAEGSPGGEMVDPGVSRAPPLIPVQPEMEPVYYSVSMHSQNRKMRLSYSLLVEIPGTLAEGRTSIAHVRWAIDAARQMMRGHQGVDWDIQAGLYENPRIPQTTRKTAENGCHVWILNGP